METVVRDCTLHNRHYWYCTYITRLRWFQCCCNSVYRLLWWSETGASY